MLIFKNGKRGEMNADELGGKWKIRHKKSSFLIPFDTFSPKCIYFPPKGIYFPPKFIYFPQKSLIPIYRIISEKECSGLLKHT